MGTCVHSGEGTDHIERYELATRHVFSYPVDTRDYQAWFRATLPLFLVLYDARAEEAYWLHVQDAEESASAQVEGDTVHLHIPRNNILGIQTMRLMRQRKQETMEALARLAIPVT